MQRSTTQTQKLPRGTYEDRRRHVLCAYNRKLREALLANDADAVEAARMACDRSLMALAAAR